MKNKKMLIIISIFLASIFALSACASSGNTDASASPENSAATEATATPSPKPETSSASPSPSPSKAPEESAPATAPSEEAPATLTMVGKITEVMDEEDQIRVVSDDSADTINDVVVNLTDETIIYNGETGNFTNDDALKVGDQVQITVSSAMTRSIPPIANGFLVVTNLPSDMLGLPNYTLVEEVTQNDDGSVTVLNQNKDTYVTIAGDMMLQVRDPEGEKEGADLAPTDIKPGERLLTWYDVVALSYPAQATATQAMLIVST